ncbi:ABC transporter permease [Mucilaginibacter sp. RS28]|uniref:ABC transporter permease n=1 Tax=Mucilaginibacter straminoryzae TaxID=2932774 RepID=A0A9X1XAL8_9SPHI|nr:ABC transporter permease [Mucilaginibacter straminoryzae]MCJ8211249.1 ABC transporter permease [Mucilaginibacter straminoryzae]
MLSTHLKIATRNLRRNFTFSVINIAGLALGIGIFLLIAEYVSFEWGFNRFASNYKNIYRASFFNGKEEKGDYYLPPGYAAALKEKLPAIEAYTRIGENLGGGVAVVHQQKADAGQAYREGNVSFVDGNFLQFFGWKLKEGNGVLNAAQTAAISASTAKKYFGLNPAVGKIIEIKNQFGSTLYTITGVYEDVPAQSDIKADVLLSFKTLENPAFRNGNDWADPVKLESGYTYNFFQIRPGTDQAAFAKLATQVTRQILPDAKGLKVELQPLKDIHLAPSFNYHFQTYGSLIYVVSFLAIAILITVIAWLNYINLSTVQALSRAKESGVRKVLGATRSQIIIQFLTETVVLTVISLLISVAFVTLVQPYFNTFLEKPLSLKLLFDNWICAGVCLVVIAGCLFSGIYVATILSAFSPLKTIRGVANLKLGGVSIRKVLVVFQFTASVILIITTITLYRQLRYMQTQDLGLSLKQKVVITGPSVINSSGIDQSVAFENRVKQLPFVGKIAASNNVPGQGYNFSAQGITKLAPAAGDEKKSYSMLIVDNQYFDTYDIKFKEGRAFTPAMLIHGWPKTRKVILNESAAKQLGFANAEQALGQKINWGKEFEVVGVIKDYHHLSLHQFIQPMIFLPAVADGYFTIKMSAADMQQHINQIKKIYEELFPGEPFTFSFLDEVFDKQYRTEQKMGSIFMSAAGIAVFIAAMGLFGLAAFTAKQKVKEIGIRKVLGANVLHIVQLISADFIKLVLVSIVIASPIAWFAMNKWLQQFAYRTGMSWWIFVAGGSLAVTIATLTVMVQSLRAASANPVKSLRNE